MDSTFPITNDGILGNHFLKAIEIIIDVGKGELTSKMQNISTISARSGNNHSNQSRYSRLIRTHNVLIRARELGKNILYGNVLNIIKINNPCEC